MLSSTCCPPANDGARVLSADITGILEYSKRPLLPSPSTPSSFTFKTSHVTTPTTITLEEAVGMSDVVISAVPGGKFKVQTSWLKDGVVCVDVAGEKNFEADVTSKVSAWANLSRSGSGRGRLGHSQADEGARTSHNASVASQS